MVGRQTDTKPMLILEYGYVNWGRYSSERQLELVGPVESLVAAPFTQ